MDRIESLIARQPKGSPLLREFYSDPEIFRRDIDRIHLRHWLCVGHESRIPKLLLTDGARRIRNLRGRTERTGTVRRGYHGGVGQLACDTVHRRVLSAKECLRVVRPEEIGSADGTNEHGATREDGYGSFR